MWYTISIVVIIIIVICIKPKCILTYGQNCYIIITNKNRLFLTAERGITLKKKGFLSKLLVVLALCLVFILPIAVVGCDDDGAKQIKITLSYGYSGVPNSTETVDQNSEGSILDQYVPAREGYTFVGWSTVEGSKEHIITNDTILDTNMTLYAIWERQKCIVTYDLNGYTGSYMVEPKVVEYDTTITVADISDIYRANYTFVGWYRNAAGSGEKVTTITVNSNITLYAKWKGDSRYANVFEYDFAGGKYQLDETALSTYEYGTTVVLPNPNADNATFALYDFLGWRKDTTTGKPTTENSIADVDYQANTSYFIDWENETINLYPVWRNKDFVMTYTNEAGNVVKETKQYNTGVQFTIPGAIEKYGYNFIGWSDGENTYTANQKVDATKNYNLTPIYEGKVAKLIINYKDSNQEEKQVVIEKKFGDIIDLSVLKETYIDSEVYVFDGWYANSEFTDDKLESLVLDGNFYGTGKETFEKNIYAKVSLTTNKISFVFGGEELFNREVEYGQNLDFVITDDEKTLITGKLTEGYEVTELIYNEVNYDINQTINFTNVTQGLVVTINVVPKKYNVVYVIGYDKDSGAEITKNEQHEFGSQVTLSSTLFNMEGYQLVGWVYEETGEQVLNNVIASMPAKDIKVTPLFTEFEYEEIKNGDVVTGIKITGFVDGANITDNLTIPQTIFSYNVVEIADSAFEGNTSIKNITLPNTLTTIGKNAFKGTTNLQCLVVSEQNNISIIKDNAFDGSGIKIINKNITDIGRLQFDLIKNATIGQEAFARTTVAYVDINALKDGLNNGKIGTGLFKGNLVLNQVSLSEVEKLAESMFEGCTNLKTVYLGSSNLTSIAKYAFKNTALTFEGMKDDESVLSFSDKLEEVGEGAFYGVKTITAVDFGVNVITIGKSAFEGCTALTGIDFKVGAQIMNIGERAFYGSGLITAVIDSNTSKGVTVGKEAFANIPTLNKVYFGSGSTSSQNGWILAENSFANSGTKNTNTGDNVNKVILNVSEGNQTKIAGKDVAFNGTNIVWEVV